MTGFPSNTVQISNENMRFIGERLALLVIASFCFLIQCFLDIRPVCADGQPITSGDQVRAIYGSAVYVTRPETTGFLTQINNSDNVPDSGEFQKNHQFFTRDQESYRFINSSLEEEEDLMLQVVRKLNTGAAAQWLSQFISGKPWNCPLRSQAEWIEAIISATQRNQLPLCKEILGLVASLISIESGFHANPLVVDPSGHGSVEDMLQRAENKLYQKYGTFLSLPVVSRLYGEYKQRYFPELAQCRTHWEIELIAKRLSDELKRDAARLPNAVGDIINREIDKLTNVIRSKGSMQLKFSTVRQVMKERGEEFTDQELLEYVYTVDGGVDVGVAALKPVFVHYAAWCAQDTNLSWLFLVGMDYNYGFFSSRNMMEQLRIRDLSGQNISIDGDMLRHDEKRNLNLQDSQTFLAAQEALPKVPQDQILNAFLLEKRQDYVYTDIHRLILESHQQRFGESPFAVIGQRTSGERAEIKYGTTLTTDTYLRKLERHLGSIPWDK
jgi:hypothetical protein